MFRRFLSSAIVLTSALALTAQDAQRLIAQGDSMLALGKPQKAVDYFDKAVKLQGDARSLAARASAWYALDQPAKMLEDLDRALKLDSISPEANYQRALYAMRGQSWTTAEIHADKAVLHANREPLRSQALITRGEARAEMKRHSTAIYTLPTGITNVFVK